MDDKIRRRIQLDFLYEMFRDRIEENVIYFVHSENDGKGIEKTIDQLMEISQCSFTGHHFEQQQQATKPLLASTQNTQFTTNSSLKSLPTANNHAQGASSNYDDSTTTTNGKKRTTSKKLKDKINGDVRCELDSIEASEEEEVELTIDERIERLQKSIDDLLLEKRASHDKASQYLSKKMFPVTSYYSELGCQCRKMIDDKTNQLVDLLLLKSQDSNSIDLHGLNPIQARSVVSKLLGVRQEKLLIDKQGKATIDVITGWGKHSVTQGQHRVRPTIVSFLKEKGIEFQYLNKGALRLTIRK